MHCFYSAKITRLIKKKNYIFLQVSEICIEVQLFLSI